MMRILGLLAVGSALLRLTDRARIEARVAGWGCSHESDSPDKCSTMCKDNADCIQVCEEVRVQLCIPGQPPKVDTVAAATAAASAASASIKEAVKAAVAETQAAVAKKLQTIENATALAIKQTSEAAKEVATSVADTVAVTAAHAATKNAISHAEQVAGLAAAAAMTTPTDAPSNATNGTAAIPATGSMPLLSSVVAPYVVDTAPAPAPASYDGPFA